jgi:hypothetical protein|tara:strand:- start:287 stop:490 length:204 start_codon:yes stop_codon:yes gene_type:complete
MNDRLRDALALKYKGEIAAAEVNIRVYLQHPVGIGEHPDIVGAIDEQIEKAANAQEKLDYIKSLSYT